MVVGDWFRWVAAGWREQIYDEISHERDDAW